jgi:hypothetical protein
MTSDRRILAIGDVHGCYDGLVRLLRLGQLVDGRLRWTAPRRTHLVILGDMIDEGAESREVIHLIRSLEEQAPDRVHVLLGNHELLLLRAFSGDAAVLNFESAWSWASTNPALSEYLHAIDMPRLSTDEIRSSFQQTYRETGYAQYPDKYDAAVRNVGVEARRRVAELLRQSLVEDGSLSWLLNLPAGAKIADWVFFHGGPPAAFFGDMVDLNGTVRELLVAQAWRHELLEPYRSAKSPIGTRNWAPDEATADRYLRQYGVRHIAFGHSPGALNGIFGRLCHRWGKIFKADSYSSLGIEGYLEILDREVWAVYTENSLATFSYVHPGSRLAKCELLWDH